MEKEVLQDYLEKLMFLQEEKDQRFTEDNFRMAIDKLGLTAKEKQELDREFDQQFKQGSNYYQNQNYKKALQYLEVAQKIEPFHLSTLMLITDCYKHLYLETYHNDYYDKIIASCNRGLKMQSHNTYFAKIETLTEKCRAALKLRNQRLLALGVGIFFAGLSGFLGATMNNGDFLVPAIILGNIAAALPAIWALPAFYQLNRLRRRLKRSTLTLKFVTKS